MFIKKVGLFALLASLSASASFAGTLTSYSVGDVLICFRSAAGANDLVVDAGPVSTFVAGSVNQRFPITAFNGNQLAAVGTNGAIWSAFTYLDDSVTPVSSQWTLFISRARSSIYTKSTTWPAGNSLLQQVVAGDMATCVSGAAANRNFNAVNTSAAIVEPDDTTGNSSSYPQGQSYDYVIGGPAPQPAGDTFNGDWFGVPEITTPDTFTTAGKVVRSDFYKIPASDSGGGSPSLIGYFEFNTNGAMTYVAYPTKPVITTLAATAVTSTNSQVNATVNPNNDFTTLFFQYGATTSYGSNSGTNLVGTTSGSYGLTLSNLTAGAVYHFRAVAYNSVGTNFGADLTFTNLAGSVQPPATPVITGFGRTNGISYISFTTGNSGTYSLRATNSSGLSAPWTNWPVITSASGSGVTITLQDSVTSSNKFYRITAQ